MEGSNIINGKGEFHANRPFVYVIQEWSSGAIFFIGTFQGNY
jgi:serpin B